MAEFKRKKVKKQPVRAPKHERVLTPAPKKTPQKVSKPVEKIRMKPEQQKSKVQRPLVEKAQPAKKPAARRSSTKKYFNVIKGNKQKLKTKNIVTAVISLIVLITLLSVVMSAPVNVIEASGNLFSMIGRGSGFPTSLSGGQTLDVRIVDSLTYILSDTNVDVFNSYGKKIISIQHSMTNPALCISEGRALVYEIGGTKYTLFNLSGIISQEKCENEIICADVSRSGRIALATKSDKYASQVEVLAADGSSVYTWYSSSGVVNNVALSSNGRRIAVSTLNVKGGEYTSVVNILKYDSPSPITSFNYNDIIYSLDTVSSNRFTVTLANSIEFCYFKNKPPVKHIFNYDTSLLRFEYGSYVAVCNNRLGNKSDNSIIIFDVRGKKIAEVNFNRTITDFIYSSKRVYCLTDNSVCMLDKESNVIKEADCDFGAVRLGRATSDKVSVVWDNKIDLLK